MTVSPTPHELHQLADKMAFPHGSFAIQPGMYLRDYFAAAALTGLLSGAHNQHSTNGIYAIHAYKAADAMLAEREKK